jgi:hypothetical protein
VASQAEHVQPACTCVQGTAAALPIAQGRTAPRLGAGDARGGRGWGSDGDGAEEEAQDDDVTRENKTTTSIDDLARKERKVLGSR